MMIPTTQAQLEAFARIDFRRAYRLARRIAKGDVSAIIERDVLRRTDAYPSLFRAQMAMLRRLASDPLCRPLWLRKAIRP
jgi:predicted nucleic acid-binding Zn ribbon protein